MINLTSIQSLKISSKIERLPGREAAITGLKNKDPLLLDTTGDAIVNLINDHIDPKCKELFMKSGMGEKIKNLPNDLTDLFDVTQALKLKLKGIAAIFVNDDNIDKVHFKIEHSVNDLLDAIDAIKYYKNCYLNNNCEGGSSLNEFLDIAKYFKK